MSAMRYSMEPMLEKGVEEEAALEPVAVTMLEWHWSMKIRFEQRMALDGEYGVVSPWDEV
jgi:hypothetical protein